MPRKPHRPTSGTVTVGGVTARRTRKAQSPATKHKVSERRVMQMRQVAYEMSMQFVAHADIGRALGVSRVRVTQLLNAEFEARRELLNKTEQQWRELEIMRTEHLQGRWAAKAEGNAPAANVYLNLAERKDRLLGLNQSHASLSIAQPNAVDPDPPGDFARLTDAELEQFEYLNLKYRGMLPDPEPAPIAAGIPRTDPPAPAAITDDRDVVAVVEREEPLPDQILRLYAEGQTPAQIRASLNLSDAQWLAIVEAARVSQ